MSTARIKKRMAKKFATIEQLEQISTYRVVFTKEEYAKMRAAFVRAGYLAGLTEIRNAIIKSSSQMPEEDREKLEYMAEIIEEKINDASVDQGFFDAIIEEVSRQEQDIRKAQGKGSTLI